MEECKYFLLPNVGYFETKFTNEQLQPIRNEVNNIKKNFNKNVDKKWNSKLVGNIKREFVLSESHSYIEQMMMPLVEAYDEQFNFIKDFNFQTKDTPVKLLNVWVNYQKKYEFNPTHHHSGFLSFVIWLSVPYNIEDEILYSPGNESNAPSSGMFEFVYSTTNNSIKTFQIPIDKNMVNNCILFPSSFNHRVYPFFTSDDYRISISGNFVFQI
jgi:hypothetical protein